VSNLIFDVDYKLTREDALKKVASQKVRVSFYIHASLDILKENSDYTNRHGNRAAISLTRSAMNLLIKEYFSDQKEKSGDRIPMRIMKYDYGVIGTRRRTNTFVWIG
jgi:hypothetical protein